MSPTRDEMARLAFAKYLLTVANSHLLLPEPLASVSLLLLHDATEHLLGLCCHHVGAKQPKEFQKYWDEIAESGSRLQLPERGRMEILNKARVSLKHLGIQPSRAQLVELQNLVRGFFEEVVRMVFGISFASVNLTAFVKNDEARKRLETATIAADEGRYNDAVTQTAYAFDAILKSSPSHSVTSLLEIPSAPYIRNDEYSMNDDAHHYFEAVNRALEEMNERVSVLLLGIDFPRFSKFQTIAPEIITPLNGQPRHFDTRRGPSEHTSDSAEFCIAFVIDSAFRIQDHPVAFE